MNTCRDCNALTSGHCPKHPWGAEVTVEYPQPFGTPPIITITPIDRIIERTDKLTEKELSKNIETDNPTGLTKLDYTTTNPPTEPNKATFYRDHEMFGDNREKAILRDGERCVKCGITREEHKKKCGGDLAVDHINGLGRGVSKDKKDNRLDNLQTLCWKCHAIKEMANKDLKAMAKLGGLSVKNKYGKVYYQKMADHMNKKLGEGQMENQTTVDKSEISLTKNQYEVLNRMEWDYYYGFNHFVILGMERKDVKKTMHELRDLGLVDFSRGLINDEGESCGSGYGIKYNSGVRQLLEKYKNHEKAKQYTQEEVEKLLAQSVQEAKAEERSRIIKLVEDYPGMFETGLGLEHKLTDVIPRKNLLSSLNTKDDLLTSLRKDGGEV